MQHRSVWRETLSREITESVSRCNLSAQRRMRELLKDAGTNVNGCGLGWGIKGNFFLTLWRRFRFVSTLKELLCWRRLSACL